MLNSFHCNSAEGIAGSTGCCGVVCCCGFSDGEKICLIGAKDKPRDGEFAVFSSEGCWIESIEVAANFLKVSQLPFACFRRNISSKSWVFLEKIGNATEVISQDKARNFDPLLPTRRGESSLSRSMGVQRSQFFRSQTKIWNSHPLCEG